MQGLVSIRYNRAWNVLLGIVINLCRLHRRILVGLQASILWQVACARFVRISLVPYTAQSPCVLPWTQWKTRPIIIVVSRQNRQRKKSHRQTHPQTCGVCGRRVDALLCRPWSGCSIHHTVDVPHARCCLIATLGVVHTLRRGCAGGIEELVKRKK